MKRKKEGEEGAGEKGTREWTIKTEGGKKEKRQEIDGMR